MDENMAKVFTIILMEINMLVIGSTIRKKVKAFLLGPTVIDTKDSSTEVISVEKARNTLLMVANMWAIGSMIK